MTKNIFTFISCLAMLTTLPINEAVALTLEETTTTAETVECAEDTQPDVFFEETTVCTSPAVNPNEVTDIVTTDIAFENTDFADDTITAVSTFDTTVALTGTGVVTTTEEKSCINGLYYEVNKTGNGITIIDAEYSLTSVNIPDKIDGLPVTKIDSWAFSHNENLVEVNLPDTLLTIDGSAFSDCGIESIKIPDSVTTIGNHAFSNCKNLKTIEFGNNVTNVGFDVFDGTPFLANYTEDTLIIGSCFYRYNGNAETVTVPDGITQICGRAFKNSGVKKVILPDSLERIELGAFYQCTNLQTITIPENVTSIETYAFFDCTSLTEVNCFSDKINNMGIGVFENTPYFNNYTKDFMIFGDILYHYYGDDETVEIPANIKTIGFSAFAKNTTLKEIILPENVAVQDGAFSNCSVLEKATVSSDVSGSSIFLSCYALKEVTIKDGVTKIPQYMFRDCTSLTSITLPNSIEVIGYYAFAYSGIRDIYFYGSPEEWEKVNSSDMFGTTDSTFTVTIYFSENSEAEVTEVGGTTAICTDGDVTTKPDKAENSTYDSSTAPTTEIAPESSTTAAMDTSESTAVLGDINCDNVINLLDLTELNQHIVGISQLNGQALINADVIADSKVDISDLTQLKKYTIKLIDKL